MTKRIVDEAFARELEAKHSSPLGERFSRLKESLQQADPSRYGVAKGLVGKIVYKLIRPVIEPLLIQNHNILKELLELQNDLFEETLARYEKLERNLYLAYVKTGESLADLAANLPKDLEGRIVQAEDSISASACRKVEEALPAYMEEVSRELKQVGKDIVSRSDMLIQHLESQVEALERDLARHTSSTGKRLEVALNYLDNLKNELDEVKRQCIIISNETQLPIRPSTEMHVEPGEEDEIYTRHQEAFRGPSELVEKRQRFYLEFFRDHSPVLDIGCGRGEFIQLLKENGVESCGLDINEKMVEICRDKGLDVVRGDLQSYFQKAEPGSLGGIFCAQVVEHISFDEIKALFRDAYSALKSDGLLVVETINPESVFALTRYFYLDPTHVSPIPPQLLKFYAQACGFKDVSIKMLSEAPESDRLYPVDLESVAPAAIQNAFERLNRDMERINNILFDHYEYAIVARK